MTEMSRVSRSRQKRNVGTLPMRITESKLACAIIRSPDVISGSDESSRSPESGSAYVGAFHARTNSRTRSRCREARPPMRTSGLFINERLIEFDVEMQRPRARPVIQRRLRVHAEDPDLLDRLR